MIKIFSSRVQAVILSSLLMVATITTVASLYFIGAGSLSDWNSSFFLSFGTGLYGAAITFVLIDLILRQKEKRDEERVRRLTLTSNLHNDFQNTDMLRCRVKVDKLFTEYIDCDDNLDTNTLYENLTDVEERFEDWLAISRLLHFWEHVAKLDSKELIDEELFKLTLLPYLENLYLDHNFKNFVNNSVKTHWAGPVKALSAKYGVGNVGFS